jgi:ribosomal protein L11 methyltransferase
VDIDELAVKISLENAEANGVAERFDAAEGSVTEILSGDLSLRQAPLVLANILAPIIARLLDDGLAKIIAPNGVLVIAGIVSEQWDEDLHPSLLKAALSRHNLQILEERRSGDWVAAVVAQQEEE